MTNNDSQSTDKEDVEPRIYDAENHVYIDNVTFTIQNGRAYGTVDGEPVPVGSWYIVQIGWSVFYALVSGKPGNVKFYNPCFHTPDDPSSDKDSIPYHLGGEPGVMVEKQYMCTTFEDLLKNHFGDLYNSGDTEVKQ